VWRPEVWPLMGPSYVVRLGQAFFQLWRVEGKRLVLTASEPAHHIAHDQYQAIAQALAAMVQSLPSSARVQVLADSKWMPVSLLLTGRAPLSHAQIEALATHRFVQMFGEVANGWGVQTSYVAGDQHALAFACSTALQGKLAEGLSTRKFAGLEPTLSWAWRRAERDHGLRGPSCLVLAEHDRSLIAWLTSSGKVQALQTAGPVLLGPAHVAKVLPLQALRSGAVQDRQAVLGASFETPSTWASTPPSDDFHWQVFGVVDSST
jgi:hypothetical protein